MPAPAPPLLDLPADRPRPALRDGRLAHLTTRLAPSLTRAIGDLARERDASPLAVPIAALAALLYRYTDQDEIPIGCPLPGRDPSSAAPAASLLRLRIDGASTFGALLAQVRECLSGDAANRHPGVECPPPQVLVALRDPAPARDNGPRGLDLSLDALADGESLALTWTYATDLFERERIVRLAGHFAVLLEGALATPDGALRRLPLLAPSERAQLAAWNRTETDFPADLTCVDLFESQVAATPERIAAVCEGTALTYAQLNARANRLAHLLIARGVGPEVRVALCLGRSLEMLIGLFGVLKAGGAYLPIDPGSPPSRIAYLLKDCGVALALADSGSLARLPCAPGQALAIVCLDRPLDDDLPPRNPPRRAGPDDLAYIIYTSGSTGAPKGVAIPHRGLANYLLWARDYYALTAARGAPVQSALTFDATITSLYLPLLAGGTVALIREGNEIAGLAAFLRANRDSLVKITPAHLEVLNRQLAHEDCRGLVHAMVIGGEALQAGTLQPWLTRAPRTRLINEYGPTETVVGCTVFEADAATLGEGEVPIGRPIANTRIYILDRHGEPRPIGVPGELCIAGAGVARGYLGRAQLTAERFVELDLLGRRERVYRSGDLARWRADGTLEYLGRLDRQVKLRGFRIELGEIEATLAQHPAVREAAVVLHGERGAALLAAYLTAAGDPPPAPAELRDWLGARLPDYMVPAAVVFMDALPLTTNGKVDRAALPSPEAAALGCAPEREPPATPTEEILAELWSEALGGLPLGRRDDLFVRGAHSLAAALVAARLYERFGVEIALREIFERPTVAGLAEMVETLLARGPGPAAADPIRPRPPEAPPVHSLAQERLWLLDALGAGAAYNLPWALRLSGDLDSAALQAALTRILERHAVLRTVFCERDGRLSASLRPVEPLDLPTEDLRGLPATEREAALARLAREESERPFDLAQGPLLRARLVRLTEARGPAQPAEHALLATLHHSAADGWSLAVLVQELAALYGAEARGAPCPLPPLPIQYADFAAWQRARLEGAGAQPALDWWKARLAGAPASIDLPTDRPRTHERAFRGGTRHLRIESGLMARLRAQGAAVGATPFMTLLAAFAVLLARHSGQSDLVVAVPSAGRPRRELEPLIGYFVNNLPVRIDLSGNPGFLDLLAQVRERVQDALAHQEVPFARLIESLAPPRTGGHDPFMQVAFALQNIAFGEPDFAGLHMRPLDLDLPGVRAELELHLWERPLSEPGGALVGECCYRADLLDGSRVERMLERYLVLLQGIAADPATPIGELPLLGAQERRQVLDDWGVRHIDFPSVPCVQAFFEDWAARTPRAPALVFAGDDGELRTLDYGELNARANRVAHALIARGIGPESPVGLCLEPSHERLVGLLGTLKAGAAYLPLDPAYPPERLRFMLEDARPALLIGHAPTRALTDGLDLPVLCLDRDRARIAALPGDNPPCTQGPDSLAYIVYTSGSTGRPKGVQVEHRGLVNVAQEGVRMFDLTPAERLLQLAPFGFDVASFEIWLAFAAGATLYLGSRARSAPGEPLAALLGDCGISFLALTPSSLRTLPPLELPALRLLILGGEPSPPDLVADWRRGRRVYNSYGPTEASIWSTTASCADPHEPAVIGGPIANTSAYVLDALGQPVPPGVAGELYVGGAGVARGYLGRPELTRERFVPNPFGTGRLYRTGDRARWRDDGQLEFLGRIDRQIKIRGFRVEPGEIEAALCADPRVKEAAAVVREDRPGDRRLVAYVVAHPCADAADAPGKDYWRALRAGLHRRLPEHMVPAAVVALPALPLGPNGKLDASALPPPDLGAGAAASRSPPRDDTERAVALVWQEVLGLPALGIDDDFFDLGGHSLLATRIVARLRAELGVALPLGALFQARTVARLSALIGAARDAQGAHRTPDAPSAPREEIAL